MVPDFDIYKMNLNKYVTMTCLNTESIQPIFKLGVSPFLKMTKNSVHNFYLAV